MAKTKERKEVEELIAEVRKRGINPCITQRIMVKAAKAVIKVRKEKGL